MNRTFKYSHIIHRHGRDREQTVLMSNGLMYLNYKVDRSRYTCVIPAFDEDRLNEG